jgi:hypothetical protein
MVQMIKVVKPRAHRPASSNPTLNLASFRHRTLRDKAAQRLLALR